MYPVTELMVLHTMLINAPTSASMLPGFSPTMSLYEPSRPNAEPTEPSKVITTVIQKPMVLGSVILFLHTTVVSLTAINFEKRVAEVTMRTYLQHPLSLARKSGGRFGAPAASCCPHAILWVRQLARNIPGDDVAKKKSCPLQIGSLKAARFAAAHFRQTASNHVTWAPDIKAWRPSLRPSTYSVPKVGRSWGRCTARRSLQRGKRTSQIARGCLPHQP